jgi:hypothetical protein
VGGVLSVATLFGIDFLNPEKTPETLLEIANGTIFVAGQNQTEADSGVQHSNEQAKRKFDNPVVQNVRYINFWVNLLAPLILKLLSIVTASLGLVLMILNIKEKSEEIHHKDL